MPGSYIGFWKGNIMVLSGILTLRDGKATCLVQKSNSMGDFHFCEITTSGTHPSIWQISDSPSENANASDLLRAKVVVRRICLGRGSWQSWDTGCGSTISRREGPTMIMCSHGLAQRQNLKQLVVNPNWPLLCVRNMALLVRYVPRVWSCKFSYDSSEMEIARYWVTAAMVFFLSWLIRIRRPQGPLLPSHPKSGWPHFSAARAKEDWLMFNSYSQFTHL